MSGYVEVIIYRCPLCQRVHESEALADNCVAICNQEKSKKAWLAQFAKSIVQPDAPHSMTLKRAWVKTFKELGFKKPVRIERLTAPQGAGFVQLPYVSIANNENFARHTGYNLELNSDVKLCVQFLILCDMSQFVSISVPSHMDPNDMVTVKLTASELIAELPCAKELSHEKGIYRYERVMWMSPGAIPANMQCRAELVKFRDLLISMGTEAIAAASQYANVEYDSFHKRPDIKALVDDVNHQNFKITMLKKQLADMEAEFRQKARALSGEIEQEKHRVMQNVEQLLNEQLNSAPVQLNIEVSKVVDRYPTPMIFRGSLHTHTA